MFADALNAGSYDLVRKARRNSNFRFEESLRSVFFSEIGSIP